MPQLRFLLSQSTIYSSIIAQQLAKATEARQRKDDRATRRKELKEERVKKQAEQPSKLRETRRGVIQTKTGKPSPASKRTAPKKATDADTSSSEEEVVVTSRRSSQVSACKDA